MAPNDKAGRVVFIGNIPYGITEEQIIETLSRVGQVLSFRLVYDKETGRPKGFGFAEFADGDAAASAVRNLNDHEIMGRKLRVDWSNDNGAGDNAPTTYNASGPSNGQSEPAAASVPQPSSLPPLPPGTDPPPNVSAPDAISRTLGSLPPPQLLDILSQMKGLVMTDPARATDLFRSAPQLAFAIFQALLSLGLVEPSALGKLIEQPAGGAPPMAPPQQPPQPTHPPQHFQGYPPQPAPTPPVQAQPPPQSFAQPNVAATLAQLPPEQQQQYAAILQLTLDQINALPPPQRDQVLQIRQALGLR